MPWLECLEGHPCLLGDSVMVVAEISPGENDVSQEEDKGLMSSSMDLDELQQGFCKQYSYLHIDFYFTLETYENVIMIMIHHLLQSNFMPSFSIN